MPVFVFISDASTGSIFFVCVFCFGSGAGCAAGFGTGLATGFGTGLGTASGAGLATGFGTGFGVLLTGVAESLSMDAPFPYSTFHCYQYVLSPWEMSNEKMVKIMVASDLEELYSAFSCVFELCFLGALRTLLSLVGRRLRAGLRRSGCAGLIKKYKNGVDTARRRVIVFSFTTSGEEVSAVFIGFSVAL